MQLDLTQTELPAIGSYAGVFVDCLGGTTATKNRNYLTLALVIEIDRTKSDGSRFTVQRRHTLNTRGYRTEPDIPPKDIAAAMRKREEMNQER